MKKTMEQIRERWLANPYSVEPEIARRLEKAERKLRKKRKAERKRAKEEKRLREERKRERREAKRGASG